MARKRSTRRFENARQAHTELFTAFNNWSSFLTTRSIETTFAIIAGNWAVHGSADKILDNWYAKYSLITAITFLGLNLLGTYWIYHLCRRRSDYADKDRERWEREFEAAAPEGSQWPYTPLIHGVSFALYELKAWAPILAGALFVLSLFNLAPLPSLLTALWCSQK